MAGNVRLIAGTDAAFSRDGERIIAGCVVWDIVDKVVVETASVVRKCEFPYVPGLLSFREAPAVLDAISRLKCDPDVYMIDGQGFAHPRRFGLACHVGIWLNRPTLGCAKRRLCGEFVEPAEKRRSSRSLIHQSETIGRVVRTKDRVRPVFVSIGHRINLDAAEKLVLRCCTRYRLPEPTRLADRFVATCKRDLLNP
jgi:deoxyribonuclease V